MLSAKEIITTLLYRQFCEQGLPLSIQETNIEAIARDNGLTFEAVNDALSELTSLMQLAHGQDYDVLPALINMYEVGNSTDELVPRNVALRALLFDKIEKAQQDDVDNLSQNDIYNDPAFVDYEKELIYANVDYLSRVGYFEMTRAGNDGFSIFIPRKDWD